MIDSRVLALLLVPTLACGARSGLADPGQGDDGSLLGGEAASGGHAATGGAGAGAECIAPPAVMASWDRALAFLPIHFPFDGDVANEGALSMYTAFDTSGDFTAGMFGQALRVGEPGFVEVTGSHELLADAEQVTIALWFRQAQGVDGMPLFDCRSLTGGFHTYRSNNGLTTCWGAGTPQVGPGDCMSFDFDGCDWHHLIVRQVASFDVLDVYLDGNWQGTIGEPGFDMFSLGNPDIRLGAGSVGFENTSITEIDDLRIYEAATDEATQCERIVGGTWQGGSCAF